MTSAKRDNYGVPSILGVHRGETIPIQATSDGKLCVSVGGTTVISANYEYKLVKTIRLNLSNTRNKEITNIDFDYIAIADIQGTIMLRVEEHEMTINKCLGMDLTASTIQVSNEVQSGYCEIWLFKKKKVTE